MFKYLHHDPPEEKEIRLNHGKEGASALPRIKSDMVIEKKRQYRHYDLLSCLPGPLHTLASKKAKAKFNNLCNTMELMEGRYDILV
jgi:hypothetical protein